MVIRKKFFYAKGSEVLVQGAQNGGSALSLQTTKLRGQNLSSDGAVVSLLDAGKLALMTLKSAFQLLNNSMIP